MKLLPTYRLITSFLSLSLLIGVSLPSGLHAKTHMTCDEMPATAHSGHGMGMTMVHTDAHDFGFACACSIKEAPVKPEAQVFQKVKTPELFTTGTLPNISLRSSETEKNSLLTSGSYLRPLLFITYESLLI